MKIKILCLSVILFFGNLVYSKSSEQYLIEGNRYFQKKDYDSAAKFYKKAVEVSEKEIARAYYNLGVAYQSKGSSFYKEAISAYEKALNNDLNLVDAYFNLGIIYFNTKDFAKAEENFNKAKELSPKDVDIREALILVKKEKEKLLDANVPLDVKKTTEVKKSPEIEKFISEEKKEKQNVEIKIIEKKKEVNINKIKIEEKIKKAEDTKTNIKAKVIICTDVLNRNPIDNTKVFTGSDKKVVVWAEIKNAIGDNVFKVKWYTPDGKIYGNFEYPFTSDGARYRVWAERKIKNYRMGDIKGKWKVEVLVNEIIVGTEEFEII